MTNQTNIKRIHILVKSSYNHATKTGQYKLYDMENKLLVKKRNFKNVVSSDNVIAFLGLCDGLKTIPRSLVYSTNSVAVIWAQNKWCNSKSLDKKLSSSIIAATEYLRCNDCSSRIHGRPPRNLTPVIKDSNS